MAITCSGVLSLLADYREVDSSAGVASAAATLRHRLEFTDELTAGTGGDQIDLIWSTSGSVTTGTPVEYDLAGGRTSLDGTAITMAKVVGVIVAYRTGTGTLTIGGGATDVKTIWIATGDGAIIGVGGLFVWYSPNAGAAVTGATFDILRTTASAGTITYDIVCFGRSV